MQTKDIISIGIFASILCIFSVITIPISSIPITLSLFAVFFISIILGLKKSLFTVIIYILWINLPKCKYSHLWRM